MTKCIYCDFNHPDHIGAEIYSGEYISETEMYDSEWSDGFEYEYAYLKQKRPENKSNPFRILAQTVSL
ncbi:hypothetical protein CP362_05295 [Lactobacillus sp. UMNPBX11]|nr:hypothetical protein AYP83_01065 [Lactobacillus crispatus]PEG90784.1 hypothetical protein CP363_05235 [Lactobacillus sp. UMNPBX12]PEG92672.1 hypothetical protein CP362_05295 [Lactobacillus sp. UMNPBX11]